MPLASAWAGPALPFQDTLLQGGLLGVYALLALASFLKYTVPFLPGDAALLVGVFWVGARDGSWGLAALSMVIGGTLGAMTAYAWGRRFGGLLSRPQRLGAGVHRVRRLLGRWGVWAIAANRFIPGARTLFLPVAGVLHMPAGPVAAAAAVSNLLFAGLLVGLGFTAGKQYEHVASLFYLFQWWICVAVIAVAAGWGTYWIATRALDAHRVRVAARAPEVEP